MQKFAVIAKTITAAMGMLLLSQPVSATLALDRTRAILNGNEKAVALDIRNKDPKNPMLAQAWIEDKQLVKITSPLAVLPPIQRVEPLKNTKVRIQALPDAITKLPQDQESMFFFNLREIPPRSEGNTLQLALHSRIRLFYRPASIVPAKGATPWQEQLTLTRVGDKFRANNPTPYYIILDRAHLKPQGTQEFSETAIPPKGELTLSIPASKLGTAPVISYVDDLGGYHKLHFKCSGNQCTVAESSR